MWQKNIKLSLGFQRPISRHPQLGMLVSKCWGSGVGWPRCPLWVPFCLGAANTPLFGRDTKVASAEAAASFFFPRRHLFKKYLKIFKKSAAAPKQPENHSPGLFCWSPIEWGAESAAEGHPEVKLRGSPFHFSLPFQKQRATFPTALGQPGALSKIN